VAVFQNSDDLWYFRLNQRNQFSTVAIIVFTLTPLSNITTLAKK